jgi:hypothetical protein
MQTSECVAPLQKHLSPQLQKLKLDLNHFTKTLKGFKKSETPYIYQTAAHNQGKQRNQRR